MSPRITILAAAFIAIFTTSAQAAPLTLSLAVPETISIQKYANMQGTACLVLDTGRQLGQQDVAGLQHLVGDLDVTAGPGIFPEAAPAGSMLYTYALAPELKGTKLIYRGLLSSSQGNAVKVASRNPASSLENLVARDLGFNGPVQFVFSRQCD